MGSPQKKSNVKLERTDVYKMKMKEITFLAGYISDIPEIFDMKTMKCKLFLIKIFTSLYPNFHYLSFLSQDDVDEELVKIASILQIYPHEPQNKCELLKNMNETNAHIFWIRFLNLCRIRDRDMDSNSDCKEVHHIKIFHSRFSNLSETLQHMNYNIISINQINLNETDINKEINLWINGAPGTVLQSENSVSNLSPIKVKECSLPEISNLINAINHTEKRTDYKSENICEHNHFYKDFFIDFSHTVKQLSVFKRNLNFMSSLSVTDIINSKELYHGINWLLYKFQIKRCNDIIASIMLKQKN